MLKVNVKIICVKKNVVICCENNIIYLIEVYCKASICICIYLFIFVVGSCLLEQKVIFCGVIGILRN